MDDGKYTFDVLSKGQHLDEHLSDACEIWVAGTRGESFELRVKNTSSNRIMACGFVDGLSVMTGEAPDGKLHGYIVEANSELIIPGWRLDEANVARFEFTESGKSYATQMGTKNEKQGYLTCSIYREKIIPPEPPKPVQIAEVDERYAFAPPPKRIGESDILYTIRGGGDALSAPAEPELLKSRPASDSAGADVASLFNDEDTESDNIGVGFGKKTEHRSRTVSFKIDQTIPPVEMSIRYDTTHGLARRGVGCAVPKGWSVQGSQSNSTAVQSPGNLDKFFRDAENRRQQAKPKGFGARLKNWFLG